ncbi:hypothetical protein EV714DRAFT_270362 [Schizophyllum commune]
MESLDAAQLDAQTSATAPEPAPEKISAYYSLVFPRYTFYVRTLSITIGRRTTPNPAAPSTSAAADNAQVDVDLGGLKSVSRLHAKIEYDQDSDRFVLDVIGRNGAWVDGVWCGSGTRAPLGERSQIQIAQRTFHFVLPPPPPPEDTPSPSSHSSTNRARSPSVDITSISPPTSIPSHSPPPRPETKPEPEEVEIPIKPPLTPPPIQRAPDTQLPDSNSISRASSSRPTKRKKPDADEPAPPRPAPLVPKPKPRPEEMPPKPQLTYAQLIYKAIKGIGGKATLQEICAWVMNNYEYYQYAEPTWMSSVRHNLSSGRAFKKGERCGGDRGKGFFWSLDEDYEQNFIDQEARAANEAKKKVKAEQPPKRVVKNEPPPPLMTSTPRPLPVKTAPASGSGAGAGTSTAGTPATPATGTMTVPMTQTTAVSGTTGVFAYNAHALGQRQPNPYSFMTAQPWTFPATTTPAQSSTAAQQSSASPAPTALSTLPSASVTPRPAASSVASPPPPATSQPAPISSTTASTSTPTPAATSTPAPAAKSTPTIPDVVIPITLGPIPPTHPDHVPNAPYNSAKEGYMILHERALVLDPRIFGGLGAARLDELGKLGARRALGELTGVMVRVLKERREERRARKAGKRARKEGKGEGKAGGAGVGGGKAAGGKGSGKTIGQGAMPPTIVMDPTPSGEDTIVVVDDDDEAEAGAPVAKKARVA